MSCEVFVLRISVRTLRLALIDRAEPRKGIEGSLLRDAMASFVRGGVREFVTVRANLAMPGRFTVESGDIVLCMLKLLGVQECPVAVWEGYPMGTYQALLRDFSDDVKRVIAASGDLIFSLDIAPIDRRPFLPADAKPCDDWRHLQFMNMRELEIAGKVVTALFLNEAPALQVNLSQLSARRALGIPADTPIENYVRAAIAVRKLDIWEDAIPGVILVRRSRRKSA
jgi:hypothetical protein